MSVALHDLSIIYGDVTAVDELTVTFPPGITGLLGVNGAGKSSLIKGLLGLVSIHSGSAKILGHDVYQERKAIRQLIGYMPEDDCLIPGLSGIQMVRYAGELCGMPRQDAIQRAHEILCLTGLEEARYRKVESYSAGMKQRIKLAQAIIHDPQLLFLDEPTSGMDPKGRQEMLDLIMNVTSKGDMSVILASHILMDVERTCNRVVMIHQGKLLEQGEMDTFRGSYANVYSVRIEGNQETFIKALEKQGCQIEHDGSHLLDVTLPKGKGTKLVLSTAKKTGVQLRKLMPSVQTLEDVFVKRIGDNPSANL